MAERTRLATAGAHAAVTARLGREPRGDAWQGTIFFALLLFAVGVAMLGLAAVIIQSAIKGSPAFSMDLFTEGPSRVNPESAGFRPAIIGSLYLIAGAILLIVPLGVGSAIYLEEYANKERWWNKLIELNIQNLAAVPSIIYGILGLAFFVRGPFDLGFVVAAGSLTLALLVLPTVILAAREAIRAVPPSIREGSLALGATAPLLLVGAATFVTADQPNPFEGGYSAMPVQIFNYALDPQDEFRTLAAAGVVVMLVVLLAMNSFAIWLRNRYEQQW
jgi:phosphate transport system permease protein